MRAVTPADVRERIRVEFGLVEEDIVSIDANGLSPMQLATFVGMLEDTYDLEFPTDLVAALSTIDDVAYYVCTKVSHGDTGRQVTE